MFAVRLLATIHKSIEESIEIHTLSCERTVIKEMVAWGFFSVIRYYAIIFVLQLEKYMCSSDGIKCIVLYVCGMCTAKLST